MVHDNIWYLLSAETDWRLLIFCLLNCCSSAISPASSDPLEELEYFSELKRFLRKPLPVIAASVRPGRRVVIVFSICTIRNVLSENHPSHGTTMDRSFLEHAQTTLRDTFQQHCFFDLYWLIGWSGYQKSYFASLKISGSREIVEISQNCTMLEMMRFPVIQSVVTQFVGFLMQSYAISVQPAISNNVISSESVHRTSCAVPQIQSRVFLNKMKQLSPEHCVPTYSFVAWTFLDLGTEFLQYGRSARGETKLMAGQTIRRTNTRMHLPHSFHRTHGGGGVSFLTGDRQLVQRLMILIKVSHRSLCTSLNHRNAVSNQCLWPSMSGHNHTCSTRRKICNESPDWHPGTARRAKILDVPKPSINCTADLLRGALFVHTEPQKRGIATSCVWLIQWRKGRLYCKDIARVTRIFCPKMHIIRHMLDSGMITVHQD